MILDESKPASEWAFASFPTSDQRQEFLDQVRLWNLIDGLPRIETVLLGDAGLRFCTAVGTRPDNVLRLVDAFGGLVEEAPSRKSA